MKNKKVLVVDDARHIVMMMTSRLKSAGYEVVAANDGESGLEMVKKEKPDIVVLDYLLPGKDGVEVCRAIKSDASTAHIPVIIFTGMKYEAEEEIENSAADAILTKPFVPEVLLSKLEEISK